MANNFRGRGLMRIRSEDGAIAELPIPSKVLEAAAALPEAPWLYFDRTPGAVLIPLDQLVQSRARSDGIANAVAKMYEAYTGYRPKRAPVDVTDLGNDYFLVRDGNSTVAIAIAAGWSSLPCRRLEGSSPPQEKASP